ncbi:glycoside hydrolase family 3 N-terminal domain-containing protein [Virgibacillus sp. 179-BFC.A HS]|uniref:beta-N-acetylhexosaminidase n=1 Tax=Tigheibacillus jepli TaxID=3035914 RepID=A0ABU5CFV4_9BACI|nr:glycoside hydrolase family 3 N-terminal domain-containing protein [Virgibacillus sp. 179-BFC.A HS]MDY0404891.1 glycoside hydrolase family 3 N-terminal domain-containing protein [Virgibacillus sp. 179-BFC.A HS]
MRKKMAGILVFIAVIMTIGFLWGKESGVERKAEKQTVRHVTVEMKNMPKNAIQQQVQHMTLDEKIGQMVIAGLSGTTADAQAISLIQDYKVGGFIFYANNLQNQKQSIQLVNQLKHENRQNRFPLFLSVDQEGASVSRLPGVQKLPNNRSIGNKDDGNFSYEIGKMLGRQVRSFGMNMDFAPVLDVDSNPNNPVIGDRSFGKNPELVANLGIQTMKGIQSESIMVQ